MFYLAEDNFVHADRASRSTALEIRAPFLDQVLGEYALSLPATSRRGLWRTKPLLRRAARPLLPSAIMRRPNHGFGVPDGVWLRGDVRELDSDRLQRQGIFDPACVSSLLCRHLDGVANHAKELWALFMFQLWAMTNLGI